MKLNCLLLLVIVTGGLGACGDGAEEEVGTTAAPDETVPAATKDPALVFDGTSCTYVGPSRVLVGGLILVALENTSDIDIDAVYTRVPNENTLNAALERIPPGTGSDIALGLPPGSVMEGWLQAPPGGRNEESLLLPAGLYLADCGRVPAGATAPDYVWRGGSFEAVEE